MEHVEKSDPVKAREIISGLRNASEILLLARDLGCDRIVITKVSPTNPQQA